MGVVNKGQSYREIGAIVLPKPSSARYLCRPSPITAGEKGKTKTSTAFSAFRRFVLSFPGSQM